MTPCIARTLTWHIFNCKINVVFYKESFFVGYMCSVLCERNIGTLACFIHVQLCPTKDKKTTVRMQRISICHRRADILVVIIASIKYPKRNLRPFFVQHSKCQYVVLFCFRLWLPIFVTPTNPQTWCQIIDRHLNLEGIKLNFSVGTVSAEGLTPFGAGTSAGTVSIRIWSRIHTAPAFEGWNKTKFHIKQWDLLITTIHSWFV